MIMSTSALQEKAKYCPKEKEQEFQVSSLQTIMVNGRIFMLDQFLCTKSAVNKKVT